MLCDQDPEDGPSQKLLHKLWEFSQQREQDRYDAGANYYNRREKITHVNADGIVQLIDADDEETPSHKLIGELMILANETAALEGQQKSIPMIFRSQEAPDVDVSEQGLDIAEGPAREFFRRSFFKRSNVSLNAGPHSSLGLKAYAQVTSPIRRVVDLFNQRQLSSQLREGKPFYSESELTELFAMAERGLSEVYQIQRDRERFWLLQFIKQEGIKTLGATVMRADGAKPLAEVDAVYSIFPFLNSGKALKPGMRIELEVERVQPQQGKIVLRAK